MTVQDWIAAAIALAAFVWLIWRFRSMMGGSSGGCGTGCSKCGPDEQPAEQG